MATGNHHGFHIRSCDSWVLLILVCMLFTFLSDNVAASRLLIPKSKPAETTAAALSSGGRRIRTPALTGGWSRIPNNSNSYSSSFYECDTEHNIAISQNSVDPLPDGTPAFTVRIMNTCTYGCSLEDIHLHCGSFASTELVDPSIFKRLAYDDCLVNDGNVLTAGSTVSFLYSNSFDYPLSLAYFTCIT